MTESEYIYTASIQETEQITYQLVAANMQIEDSNDVDVYKPLNIRVLKIEDANGKDVFVDSAVSKENYIRIFHAANRISLEIILVGSHARGTAKATSDWDYIIEKLNNKKWKKIKNSIPGAKSIRDGLPKNYDLLKVPLNKALPYMIVSPSLLLNIIPNIEPMFIINN